MRYGGSQQSPEKFIIFHAPTKNDRSHGRFLLSSRATLVSLLWNTLYSFPSVQRTLCHSEKLHSNDVRIPRKGTILQTPRKILLYLRGEKGAHKQKSEHYRPPDNAISKAQFAPYGRVSAFCFPLSRLLLLFFCITVNMTLLLYIWPTVIIFGIINH